LLIFATDGLLDNLSKKEVLKVVQSKVPQIKNLPKQTQAKILA